MPRSRIGWPLTGQILNIGGPEEFAKSIDEQRAADRGLCQGARHQAAAIEGLVWPGMTINSAF